MASTTKSAREQRKKTAVRVVAVIACVALLLTAILPFLVR